MQTPTIQKINLQGHIFQAPSKKINSPDDLERFKKHQTYSEIMFFIYQLQLSVQGKSILVTPQNPKFTKIVSFLEELDALLLEVPPIHQAMRFGNKAFKDYMIKMEPIIDKFLTDYLVDQYQPAAIELKPYIMESFGSTQRIDYGTGHEFNFFLFLMCLYKIGLYDDEDFESLVRNVFYRYITLIRKVQLQYMLEPAGSHGVWGLDDYQFLPFLFGASELIDNQQITPEAITRETLVHKYKTEYQFFQCVDFVLQVKKGPFHEHSPIIHSLTNVPNWNKVSQGLLKMFSAELMNKLPVIKHTQFGSIVSFD